MTQEIKLNSEITSTQSGQRLDQTLADLFPDYSRTRIKEWILSGAVSIDGTVNDKPRVKVLEGQEVVIDATLEEETSAKAEAIDLDIVYEDDHILVINKQAGLVVHPGAGNQDGTLMNALLHHCPGIELVPRAGIVHRLDKDTTGLMVVAKTVEAQTHLVTALQAREITREYEAIVQGGIIAGGTIDEPIDRHPTKRTHMAVVHNGKPAMTHYRVAEKFRLHTRLRLRLESGRTHQIRVHMAYIGHVLVGDPVYAGRPRPPKGAAPDFFETYMAFRRQALHAIRLELAHPFTCEIMSWQAPVPEDMVKLTRALRQDTIDNPPRYLMTDVFDDKQAWFIPSGVNLAFSTRKGGKSLPPYDSLNLGAHVGDSIDSVNCNRDIIQQRLNLPVIPAWLKQTHSIRVVDADNLQVHNADASYCNNGHQVCVVMTADCLPILLCDKNGTEVAAVHAGWRGLCDGIIEAAINKFIHSPEELIAYLGPAIGPNTFEVGSEVKQQFEEKHSEAQHYFSPVSEHLNGKYLADLQGLAKLRLAKAGINMIFADLRCTVTDHESFFSYRRDGVTGRMASFIWLDI